MDELLRAGALVCTLLALLSGGLALLALRRLLPAVQVLLDLLLAAGLLRLAAHPDAGGLAAAAALVVVRRLASAGLREGGRIAPARAADGSG